MEFEQIIVIIKVVNKQEHKEKNCAVSAARRCKEQKGLPMVITASYSAALLRLMQSLPEAQMHMRFGFVQLCLVT